MIPDRPGPTPLRSLLFVREAGAWKLAHLHATTNRVLVWTDRPAGAHPGVRL